jgi:quercetin dioxygenase-like cupin family protein
MKPRVAHADDVALSPPGERRILDESLFALSVLAAPATRRCAGNDELLFVLAGRGTLHVDAAEHELAAETAASIPRGMAYRLDGDLRALAVAVRDPDTPAPPPAVVRLADRHADPATANRSFRLLCEPGSATQFVGFIPTETAPDHYHLYDEVIYVLEGHGVVRMPGIEAPLRPGTAISLPARTVHCLENTGASTMRVLGVFRPAGSPAAAYYPDGTPAFSSSSSSVGSSVSGGRRNRWTKK